MRYAILREDEPGCFESTGETVDCAGPEEAAAHVAALQAEDPQRRCYAASLAADAGALVTAGGAGKATAETP